MRLCHITTTTGHSRWSTRSEVDPGLLAQLGPLIVECEHRGAVEIPTPSGLMLLSRLLPHSPSRHVACWSIRDPQGPALVTMGIAMRARQGAGLWRELHAVSEPGMPRATSADSAPPAPWLGVALHLPLILAGASIHWLGDAERCIAWTWIEHVWKRI